MIMISAIGLVAQLTERLRLDARVNSIVLRGSRTAELADAFSDIDLSFGTTAGASGDVFGLIRTCLQSIGRLDLDYENVAGTNQIFHIQGASRFLVLDISTWMYEETSSGGGVLPQAFAATILFDRYSRLRLVRPTPVAQDVIRWLSRMDHETSDSYLASRFEKHLRRKRPIAAAIAYHTYLLKPLLLAARLRFAPDTWQQGISAIDAALPPAIAETYTPLIAIASTNQLRDQSRKVRKLLRSLLDELRAEWITSDDSRRGGRAA